MTKSVLRPVLLGSGLALILPAMAVFAYLTDTAVHVPPDY